MDKPKILTVDDEPLILKTISAYLEQSGFEHREVRSGPEALDMIGAFNPDFIILDLMLPGMNGREVLKQLRHFSDAHVTILSALGDEKDRVNLLEAGADDYIVKPFSPGELVARIEAYFRRRNKELKQPEIIRFGDVVIDRAKREVVSRGVLLELTPTEFDILGVFIDSVGRVLSRNRIIEIIWGSDFFIEERAIDVHIRRLRKKIETDPSQPEIIVTSRGAGYRFGDIRIWYD